ncbi:hypothetical protein FIBSPDRAFT_87172 [Athelia psychrophila]|uniref:Uncharacterized protein n=1 Tax=Athelia psychrophila TaxID=1759441 RepID=A0A167SVB8_9AGAM|nr:hypothetical protein FIBSPDRAFT_87172 [Fibularhizoctonia sp. CBS 109695]
MFLFLLFLCAIAASGIHALALPVEATSDDSKYIDITHCRTIWNIIWSSLATIFVCAWVSVHRNVPSPASGGFTVTLEQIRITVWALVVPEYIIAWAIRQWIVACQISEESNKLQEVPPPVPARMKKDSSVLVGLAMRAMVIIDSQHREGPWSRFTRTAASLFPKKNLLSWTATLQAVVPPVLPHARIDGNGTSHAGDGHNDFGIQY